MPARMPRRLNRASLVACVLAVGLVATACGSESSTVDDPSASVENGARLFVERCSGCHTFDVVGADGGASEVHDRERVDGPSFDTRAEDRASVLYAIRNGGFSGAIMPENLVVGQEAEDVAAFVAKYAGGEGGTGGGGAAPAADAGSGGGGESTASTETETTATTETQTTPAAGGEQAAARGKQVFTESCAGCHTLSDAGSNGSVGPNLDEAQPDREAVEQKVLNGGGGMPAFRGQLSDDDVAAVSEYVSSVAGG